MKRCNTVKVKNGGSKRPYHKRVSVDDLDRAIHNAQCRVNHLKRRKEALSKNKVEDENKKFYDMEVKGMKFVSKYKTYQEAAIQAGKMFSAFHLKVWNALDKHGTVQEKDAFKKLFYTIEKEAELK